MDAIKRCSTCWFENQSGESDPCSMCSSIGGSFSQWRPREADSTELDAARRAGRAEGLMEASVIADEVGTRSNTDLWTAEEIVRAIDARAEEVERNG